MPAADDRDPPEAENLVVFAAALEAHTGELDAAGIAVDPAWPGRVEAAIARLAERPEVAIAMLGGTGAGKSTLVNALVESRLLPVSSMRACTSAITEVAHAEGPYSATVEFIDRRSWGYELGQLEQDLADQRAAAGEQGADLSVSRAAEDKLKALYGESAVLYLVSLDPDDLVECEEVTRAFEAGSVVIEHDDEAAFRQEVARYLDSQHPFWPIVKRVRVRGPFEPLGDGMVLVDLPGLNDPNAAREEATKEHLRSAQFVWVVFNMKRALTRDVFEFLRRDDLLRRLFMDGRTGSLLLVGTASDDIDVDADIERFGLDEDATEPEIVRRRSEEVERVVREQLLDLAGLLARDAGEPPAVAAELRAQLEAVPVHCVSAKEYQKCRGLMQRRGQVLHNPLDTRIPQLQEAASELVRTLGRAAQLDGVRHELLAVRSEMVRAVELESLRRRAEAETSAAQREEVRAAAARASTFLEQRAQRATAGYRQALATAAELLMDRLRRAHTDARAGVDDLAQGWRSVHWATLRATTRRGGVWTSRDRRLDLPGQVAKPVLDGVAFAWVEFFGHRALVAVDALAQALLDAAADHAERFDASCRRVEALAALLDEHGAPAVALTQQQVEARIAAMCTDVEQRLERDRRDLAETVQAVVAEAMGPAFERAASQRGTGTWARMVEDLRRGAEEATDRLEVEVSALVGRLLRDLVQELERRGVQVVAEVERSATELRSVVAERAEADAAPRHQVDLSELDRLSVPVL